MKNYFTSSLLLIALAASQSAISQDYHFSQFRETPILINPAQTALNKDVRVVLNYKDQWSSVATPFKTFAVSGEYAINHKKGKDSYMGVGLQVVSDKAGDAKMGTTLGLLSFNGIVGISRNVKLAVGLVGGYGQRSVNAGALQWGDQYVNGGYKAENPTAEVVSNSAFNFPDLGAGIAFSYGRGAKYISANDGLKAIVGVSAYHFGVPKYTFYSGGTTTTDKLNTKITAHGSVSIGIESSNLLVIPEFIFVRQGSLQEINLGSMFKFILSEESRYTKNKKASAYTLGAHYRVKDALIFTGMFEYSNYSIGLSYDTNISKLTSASKLRGGMEVSLRFVTPNQFSSNRARI